MTTPYDRRSEARQVRYSPCLIRDEAGHIFQGMIGDAGAGGVQLIDAETLQVGQKVRVFSLPASINESGCVAWRRSQAAGIVFLTGEA